MFDDNSILNANCFGAKLQCHGTFIAIQVCSSKVNSKEKDKYSFTIRRSTKDTSGKGTYMVNASILMLSFVKISASSSKVGRLGMLKACKITKSKGF